MNVATTPTSIPQTIYNYKSPVEDVFSSDVSTNDTYLDYYPHDSFPLSPILDDLSRHLTKKNNLSNLHSEAIRLLPNNSTLARCQKSRNGNGSVNVWEVNCKDGSQYVATDLYKCRNAWVCPFCANALGWKRAKELKSAIAKWEAKNNGCLMVTFTAWHDRSRTLAESLKTLQDAYKAFHSGRAWLKLKNDYKIAGEIRAIEVTYNYSTHWHPHLHSIIFLKDFDFKRMSELEELFRDRWRSLIPSNDFGLKAEKIKRPGYISKGVKLSEDEEHPTLWNLLEDSRNGSIEAGKLFGEYAHAVWNKQAIRWSPKLRQVVGLGKALTDTKLLETAKPKKELDMVTLSAADWRAITTKSSNKLRQVPAKTDTKLHPIVKKKYYRM